MKSVIVKRISNLLLVLMICLIALPGPSYAVRDILLPPGNGTVWHGVWLPTGRTISASQITTFESQAGKKVGIELYYVGWYLNAWSDVQRQINVWGPMGIKTHITWEPNLKGGGDPLAAILNGSQDAIINDFATKAKAYGQPFFLRFAHEMNGNWYAWSGALTGNNPQKYIDAWRYVWNKFQAVGATNAVWVWSPNWNSVPNLAWNDLHNYYPGDAYVDWVGIDFYGLKWDDIPVATNLDAVYTAYSAKPIMVAETAAADCTNYVAGATHTKDQWINDLFTTLANRPAVRAFTWFNENKTGEANWTITSCPSPAAQNAYKTGVSNPRYVTRP